MKTTSAWFGIVALLAAASGCDSEVVGGGGGAGGGAGSTTGGDGGAAATGTSVTTGEGASSGESTGTTGPASSTSTGTAGGGGGGGGNALGDCEAGSGTGATSTGMFECSADYTCDGGEVTVTCLDDGTTETCDCFLDGNLEGTCVEENDGGCSLPVGCCYALLGGEAQPNPGPYGACQPGDGSSAQSGGGETACGATYTCDGGELWIDCSGVDGQSATCECRDGQGFLLATCEQASVDCDYASGCCFDLVN